MNVGGAAPVRGRPAVLCLSPRRTDELRIWACPSAALRAGLRAA